MVGRTTCETGDFEVGSSFYLTDTRFQSADLIESIQGAPPPYFAARIPDPSNLPFYGNRRLTPENASTIEAGLRGHELDGAVTESPTYWHSYVANVITFDYSICNPRIVNGTPYGQYANTEAERSQGVEFEMACRIASHWLLTGNYTHTDAYLDNAGVWELMIENARNMGNLGLTYTTSRFDVGANLFATDRRLRWAGDFRVPGYARLDFFGRYHVTGRLALFGRVQNALDRRIVEVLGYRTPGVYFIAGANYKFN